MIHVNIAPLKANPMILENNQVILKFKTHYET